MRHQGFEDRVFNGFAAFQCMQMRVIFSQFGQSYIRLSSPSSAKSSALRAKA
jgi:hypothetical protein